MPRDTDGLAKWFKENWVDIGSKKKMEAMKNAVENLPKDLKENILNACQLQKLKE